MEFTVSRADLVRELNLSQGVVEKKTTIPILSNVSTIMGWPDSAPKLAMKKELFMYPYKSRTSKMLARLFKLMYGRGKRA